MDLPVRAQGDLVPRLDDVEVGDARLRASEAAVAPLDGADGVHLDALPADAEVRRERVDRQQRGATLGVGQLLGGPLAGREADVLRAGGEGEEGCRDGNGNSRHLSLRGES